MAERCASGGGAEGGRAYSGSGSGGHVVRYQDLESLDVDHYDFINAPQYVDFSDLAKSDDPNADLFFESHREEDDFLISIDNISPTVQLLNKDQQNLLNAITKEVNAAAAMDGMDDVKVVYYDSPVSANKKGTTADHSLTSLNSSMDSFYTPIGDGDMENICHQSYNNTLKMNEQDGDRDKENTAPESYNDDDNDTMKMNEPEKAKERHPSPVKKLLECRNFNNQKHDPIKKSNLTKPYEFHAAVEKSTRIPMKANHYVSVAEAIAKFHKNTPERFRTLPRGKQTLRRSASCDLKPLIKREKSPSPARVASKPTSAVGRGRAGSISSGHHSGKPKAPSHTAVIHKTTIPQPFHFSAPRQRHVETKEDTQFKFKARPAPKANGPKLPEKKPIHVTNVKPFHFKSDDLRSTTQTHQDMPKKKVAEEKQRSKELSTSHTNPVVAIHKTTTPQPFHLSATNQRPVEVKEDSQFKFKARPAPKTNGPKLPEKKPIHLTNVKPFHFKSDERVTTHQDMLKKKLEEEKQRLKELATFHATPPLVLHQPAFVPQLPTRTLEPLDIHLKTEKRAVEREQFDHKLREKELEDEKKRAEEEVLLEEQRKLQEIELRRRMVHKAQPFKIPKKFEPKPSKKDLTVPQSPAFNPLPSQRTRRTSPASKTFNTSM